MKLARVTLALLFTLGALAGCGGDDDDGGAAKEAEKADTATAKPTGNINVCIGKDTSGLHGKLTKEFNSVNKGANAKLVELPESADEQRTQMVQRLRAKSSECDLLALDVIWTAEFAAQGWLKDVSALVEKRQDEFIASTLETVKYEDKYFAVPYNSNAGFLFYRSDKVDAAPETWQDVYDQAKDNGGHIYQGARYEGLTVHFLELLFSAGGTVLSDDGKQSEIDSEQAREVVQFMVDGIEDGSVPKAVTTYKEEEARRAFENGRPATMRQWPYAYTLGQDAAKVKGKFEVAPFPRFGDGEPASILGGYNLAISSYTKNEPGALALIDFLTSKESQVISGEMATPPVVTAAYDDPKVKKGMPGFSDPLLKALEQGKARPVSPVYPQISEAIYKPLHSALSGRQSPDAAVKQMQSGIEKALQTF